LSNEVYSQMAKMCNVMGPQDLPSPRDARMATELGIM
jgi:hypothetical protein